MAQSYAIIGAVLPALVVVFPAVVGTLLVLVLPEDVLVFDVSPVVVLEVLLVLVLGVPLVDVVEVLGVPLVVVVEVLGVPLVVVVDVVGVLEVFVPPFVGLLFVPSIA